MLMHPRPRAETSSDPSLRVFMVLSPCWTPTGVWFLIVCAVAHAGPMAMPAATAAVVAKNCRRSSVLVACFFLFHGVVSCVRHASGKRQVRAAVFLNDCTISGIRSDLFLDETVQGAIRQIHRRLLLMRSYFRLAQDPREIGGCETEDAE
jgi:hypothetical protein